MLPSITGRVAALAIFQKKTNFKFKNISLLDRALTHRSYVNESNNVLGHNERLEFLGDSILGAAVSARLFTALADKSEGELARVKSFVVSENTLAKIALTLGLDNLLLLGKGEELSGGRQKKAILADALEAVFGAAFLDSGFKKTQDFILSLIQPEIDAVLQYKHAKDYKTLLQEYAQKWHHNYPVYILDKKTGPEHNSTYWISCVLFDNTFGPCTGSTKKDAEQAAAAMAYNHIVKNGGAEAEKLLGTKRF